MNQKSRNNNLEARLETMGYALKENAGRPGGVLGDYIRQIEDVSDHLLTPDEEQQLAFEVASGNREARNQLVQANAKLVIRIAAQYRGRGHSMEDLVGEGNLGLIRAAEDFNPEFGVRFSTYAAHWIKQAIRLALTNTSSVIRLPSHMVALLRVWAQVETKLEKKLGRAAGFNEVADELQLNEAHRSHVRKALKARSLSVESTIMEESCSWSIDSQTTQVQEPSQTLEQEEQQLWLRRRMTLLNDRERAVITLRYGLHGQEILTWNEIGSRLGVTREWARKIELKALEKLRMDARHRAIANHHHASKLRESDDDFRKYA